MPTEIIGYKPPMDPFRVDFNPIELRKQLFEQGMRVRWEKRSRCSCGRKYEAGGFSAQTKQAPVKCPLCNGTGNFYYGAQTIQAIVNESSMDPKWLQQLGSFTSGVVGITLLPEHLPNHLDRFVVLDEVRIYTERYQRTGATTALTYPIVERYVTVGSDSDPSVPATMLMGVLYASRSDANGNVVDGEMLRGVDFNVVDGVIVWIDGGGGVGSPAVGEWASFVFTCHPSYIVKSHPHTHRDCYVGGGPTLTELVGAWNPLSGAFPSGATHLQYWTADHAGTVDGVEFVVGDFLVAIIDSPSTTQFAGNWSVIQDGVEPEPLLNNMTVRAMCWLEDMGDPLGR